MVNHGIDAARFVQGFTNWWHQRGICACKRARCAVRSGARASRSAYLCASDRRIEGWRRGCCCGGETGGIEYIHSSIVLHSWRKHGRHGSPFPMPRYGGGSPSTHARHLVTSWRGARRAASFLTRTICMSRTYEWTQIPISESCLLIPKCTDTHLGKPFCTPHPLYLTSCRMEP